MPSGLRSSLSALRFSGVKEVKYLGGGGNAAESAPGGCSAMAICRCRCWTWGLEVRDLAMSRYAVGCVGVRTGVMPQPHAQLLTISGFPPQQFVLLRRLLILQRYDAGLGHGKGPLP